MIATVLAYSCDLSQGVNRTPVKPLMALANKNAHIFQVNVMRNGVPETLTGAGCSATFVRADDVSVPLDGTVDGSTASVTLSDACYRVPGKFKLTINLSATEITSAIFIGVGSVMLTSTDTIVDEEKIIPSLEDIIAQQQASIAAANAANTAAGAANDAAEEATTAASTANAAAANAAEKAQEADAAADRANNAAQAAEDVVAGKLPFFDGTPSSPGEAAAGVSTLAARGDHVHPLPSLLPISNGGTGATSAEGVSQNLKAYHIVGTAMDANEAKTIGSYVTTSRTTNLPSGIFNGSLFNVSTTYTFDNQSGIIDQFFIPINNGKIWRRSTVNDREWTEWKLVVLDSYPVGSVYISFVSTSPASLFGGEWTQIKDRFLVGIGDSFNASSTGGASSVTLKNENLPNTQVTPNRSTDRFVTMCGQEESPDGFITPAGSGTLPLYWGGNWGTKALGSGSAFSTLPPYQAVYMWRRTA